jgi:hypothetical protein
MKTTAILFALLLCIGFSATGQDQEIDSSEDEKKVMEAVVNFADSVYYMHKEYKFEKFHAFYTEDYFIQVMRSRVYKERVADLESDKKNGRYKKTEADYEKEHQELSDAYHKVQAAVDGHKERVTHFEIHFWSNIQTNDGITVYYEQIMHLDNDFKVTNATINSSIGAKSDKTAILYKKGCEAPKKKVATDAPNAPIIEKVPDTKTADLTTTIDVEETEKEKKKRLKKEKKLAKKK